MADPAAAGPVCPKCGTAENVVVKLLLIGKQSPAGDFCGPRKDQLAVDECLPGRLRPAPLEQMLDGFYCRSCGVGFVPDHYVRR